MNVDTVAVAVDTAKVVVDTAVAVAADSVAVATKSGFGTWGIVLVAVVVVGVGFVVYKKYFNKTVA